MITGGPTYTQRVRVERPIEEVFAFVSDPSLFPRWNSAVQAVELTSGVTGALGSIYAMPGRRDRPRRHVVRRDQSPLPLLLIWVVGTGVAHGRRSG